MKDDCGGLEALEQVFLVLICSGAWPLAQRAAASAWQPLLYLSGEALMIMDAGRLASPFEVAHCGRALACDSGSRG